MNDYGRVPEWNPAVMLAVAGEADYMKTDAVKKCISNIVLFSIVFSLALSQTACSSLLPKEEDALAVPLVTPAAVAYKTQAAALSSISDEISMSGKVIASQQQNLYFTCDKGRLKEISVTSGDKVKAGDVLATIETNDLDNKISMQQLEVEKAKIQYDAAGGSSNIDLQIAIQQIEVDNAQIQCDQAGVTTDIDLKISLQNLEVSKAQLLFDTAGNQTDLELQIALQKIEVNSASILYSAVAGTADIDAQIELQKLNIAEAQAKFDATTAGTSENTLASITLQQQQLQLSTLISQKARATSASAFDKSLAANSLAQQQLKLDALNAQKGSFSSYVDKDVASFNLKEQQLQLDALNAQKNSTSTSTDKTLADNHLKEQQLQLNELLAQKNGTSKNTEKSLALINLKEQKIMLDALTAQKAGSTITAPFDGEITYTCKNNLGDVIDGYTTIATICDPTTLIVATNDQLASGFSVGGDATIVLRDNSTTGATVIETPTTIDSKSEYAAYSFLSFSGDIPASIKYGTNVMIKYVTQHKDNAIVVPKKYVVSSNNRKYVVVLEDGLRTEKDVAVGITNDTDAEIVTGLKVGDLIILS